MPGKHFVMAKADDLTTCCEYYLNHAEEREGIAEAAYNFMRDCFTQEENCRAFMQQITKEFQRGKARGGTELT